MNQARYVGLTEALQIRESNQGSATFRTLTQRTTTELSPPT